MVASDLAALVRSCKGVLSIFNPALMILQGFFDSVVERGEQFAFMESFSVEERIVREMPITCYVCPFSR